MDEIPEQSSNTTTRVSLNATDCATKLVESYQPRDYIDDRNDRVELLEVSGNNSIEVAFADENEVIDEQTINISVVERELIESITSLSVGYMIYSIFLFVLSGIFEIGGGYLIWIGIRNKYKPELTIPFGCIVLIVYGFVPTLQPVDSFGRTFAGEYELILTF